MAPSGRGPAPASCGVLDLLLTLDGCSCGSTHCSPPPRALPRCLGVPRRPWPAVEVLRGPAPQGALPGAPLSPVPPASPFTYSVAAPLHLSTEVREASRLPIQSPLRRPRVQLRSPEGLVRRARPRAGRLQQPALTALAPSSVHHSCQTAARACLDQDQGLPRAVPSGSCREGPRSHVLSGWGRGACALAYGASSIFKALTSLWPHSGKHVHLHLCAIRQGPLDNPGGHVR